MPHQQNRQREQANAMRGGQSPGMPPQAQGVPQGGPGMPMQAQGVPQGGPNQPMQQQGQPGIAPMPAPIQQPGQGGMEPMPYMPPLQTTPYDPKPVYGTNPENGAYTNTTQAPLMSSTMPQPTVRPMSSGY